MKYQRSLSKKQLEVLTVLYSFRFSTRSLISQYLGIPNSPVVYRRLESLVEREYIAKRYDKSYKLAGREAEYYVTPKGLRELRSSGSIDVTEPMITALYKDPGVSEAFICQHVVLFAIRNQLVTAHSDLQYFTARDIQLLDYFPEPRPIAFISLKTKRGVSRFFVEYIPAETHSNRIKYRLKAYMQYFDHDDWSATGTPFPYILYITENGMVEKGVRRHIEFELYKADTDIQFFTTTQKALLNLR
ncbi:replication-relaxation family protein, partial [Candidatus Nomurabacteria bacterium]|nr:replication-relaxation family protein [Candidatus Nomurabacteria bacterium]